MTEPSAPLRARVRVQLQPRAWPREGLSPVNRVIVVLIVLASVTAVLETEARLVSDFEWLFSGLEVLFVSVFLVEYPARVWVAV